MKFIISDYKAVDFFEILKHLRLGENPILIKDFPNDDNVLKDFIKKIGDPIIDFRSRDEIFKVTANKTQNNFECFANNTKEFTLHTDCSDFDPVPNGLAMFIEKSSKSGGESFFINVNTILSLITDSQLELLTTKIWGFRRLSKTILEKQSNQNYYIRYNNEMLLTHSEMNVEEYMFLKSFDELLARNCIKTKLKENDLVLCNNLTMLHGRSSFEDNNRLIKRIRFHFKT